MSDTENPIDSTASAQKSAKYAMNVFSLLAPHCAILLAISNEPVTTIKEMANEVKRSSTLFI